MSERIVADSTCLIALERISHLDILPALFEPVFDAISMAIRTLPYVFVMRLPSKFRFNSHLYGLDHNFIQGGEGSNEFHIVRQTNIGNAPQSSCRASKTTRLFLITA